MSTSSTTEPPAGTLHVGRTGRPHGVRGELIVDLFEPRAERTRPGSRWWIAGQWRTVSSCAPHSGRFRASLDGVADRTAAESLVNREVWAEPVDDPSTVWVHDLIGSVIVDQHGAARGRVVAVVDNPAHPIMELEDGTLVPCPFIVASGGGRTEVSVPEGLFDGAD
ncbi:MAG: hypothetical protein EBU70_01225 [Actinobacteria bacterium]|nr:hypothetical protein [Actinomycetota bacterium]